MKLIDPKTGKALGFQAKDRLPGVFFTLGFGGNGMIYSILAAELIRDRLCDVTNPYEGLFRFDR